MMSRWRSTKSYDLNQQLMTRRASGQDIRLSIRALVDKNPRRALRRDQSKVMLHSTCDTHVVVNIGFALHLQDVKHTHLHLFNSCMGGDL